MDKKLEKKFMKAMTKRLHQYEEGFKTGYIGSCNICNFETSKRQRYSDICPKCPLNSMDGSGHITGCITPTRRCISVAGHWNEPELLKARYEELITHLNKVGYVYE